MPQSIYARMFLIAIRLEIEGHPYPNGKNVHFKVHHTGFSGADRHLIMDLPHLAVGDPHNTDIEFDRHVVRRKSDQPGRDAQREMLSGFIGSPVPASIRRILPGKLPIESCISLKQRKTFAIPQTEYIVAMRARPDRYVEWHRRYRFQIDPGLFIAQLQASLIDGLERTGVDEPRPDHHIVAEKHTPKTAIH